MSKHWQTLANISALILTSPLILSGFNPSALPLSMSGTLSITLFRKADLTKLTKLKADHQLTKLSQC